MTEQRIEIIYNDGRTVFSGAPTAAAAETLKNKYLALPNVRNVSVKPVTETEHVGSFIEELIRRGR